MLVGARDEASIHLSQAAKDRQPKCKQDELIKIAWIHSYRFFGNFFLEKMEDSQKGGGEIDFPSLFVYVFMWVKLIDDEI